MLLANTATKLFFRSTDGMAQRYVGGLCPLTPGRPSVADMRPLSTLRPGECYAVLVDNLLISNLKIGVDTAAQRCMFALL